jgi:hypothetical protein
MFRTKAVEKIKIHILCSIIFSENRAVYEKMSKNVDPEGVHGNMAASCMLD